MYNTTFYVGRVSYKGMRSFEAGGYCDIVGIWWQASILSLPSTIEQTIRYKTWYMNQTDVQVKSCSFKPVCTVRAVVKPPWGCGKCYLHELVLKLKRQAHRFCKPLMSAAVWSSGIPERAVNVVWGTSCRALRYSISITVMRTTVTIPSARCIQRARIQRDKR